MRRERQDQGQQPMMPQAMGFVTPQLDMSHHPYGIVTGPPNFSMSAAYAGQPVVSPIIFPYPMTSAYMHMPPGFQQGQPKQPGDIGAITDRMGEMRFNQGPSGRDHFQGGHYPEDLYGDRGGFDSGAHQSRHQREYHGQMQRADQQRMGRGGGGMGGGGGGGGGGMGGNGGGGGYGGRQNNSRGGQTQNQAHQPRRPQKGMEEKIKRTVYISSIDLKVTEAELAGFFSDCGRVVDCRICGDPNLAMRFAFIEFQAVEGVQKALAKNGIVLMDLPLRILPSKTAILPVSKELMPRSQEDIERCSRTVYVANIDKKVNKDDVRNFFEDLCGKVSRLRLLGDYAHPTRIAFVEFVLAEGAMAALHCSGAMLGSLPLRVSPSKTPVKPDMGSAEDQAGGSGGRQNRQRQQQQQQQQQQQELEASSGGSEAAADAPASGAAAAPVTETIVAADAGDRQAAADAPAVAPAPVPAVALPPAEHVAPVG